MSLASQQSVAGPSFSNDMATQQQQQQHTPAPPPKPLPPSPPVSPTFTSPTMRSNSTKRERRTARNSRPPHSADGDNRPPPPLPTATYSPLGGGERVLPATASGSGSGGDGEGSFDRRSSAAHSPSRTPTRRATAMEEHRHVAIAAASSSPSSSIGRSRSAKLLSLPFYVQADRARTSSTPMVPSPDQYPCTHLDLQSEQQQQLSRAQSMRESNNSSSTDPWHLPSHRNEPPRRQGDRRLTSPSASMSLLLSTDSKDEDDEDEFDENEHVAKVTQHGSWATRNARRWSSSLPRGRDSAAFALRLAEGASPYLRAGLEELRSIFDVDSNPVPSSPFVDDEDSDGPQLGCSGGGSDVDTCTLSRASSLLSSGVDCTQRKLTASPAALSSRDISPSRSSIALRRTPSDEEYDEKRSTEQQQQQQSSDAGTASAGGLTPPLSNSLWYASSASSLGRRLLRPGMHYRGESGLGEMRPPVVNRRLLGWSLSVIAVGIIVLCAWGYAMQSDTFSTTLIGFFLTQPAFALAALVSLIMRRRTWMDLFSRAMRAHVLAQALIVVLAYLDLSASSFYVNSAAATDNAHAADAGRTGRDGAARRFSMVPSMEMRFGPLHRATEAGEGASRIDDLLHRAANNMIGTGGGGGGGEQTLSSLHAHDSVVGDWRSRLTHFVVFVVQAAAPIVMVLVGQYIVAQRLGVLARQGTLSRQNSARQDTKTGGSSSSNNTGSNANGNSTLAATQPYVPGTLLATHQPLSIGTHRPVPRLHLPATTTEHRAVPKLHLPCVDGRAPPHPRHRREERRMRVATSPGTVTQQAAAAEAVSPLPPPLGCLSAAQAAAMASHSATTTTSEQQTPQQHLPSEQRRRAHRHHRSVSHPVNFLDPTALKPVASPIVAAVRTASPTGLGVTLGDEAASADA